MKIALKDLSTIDTIVKTKCVYTQDDGSFLAMLTDYSSTCRPICSLVGCPKTHGEDLRRTIIVCNRAKRFSHMLIEFNHKCFVYFKGDEYIHQVPRGHTIDFASGVVVRAER